MYSNINYFIFILLLTKINLFKNNLYHYRTRRTLNPSAMDVVAKVGLAPKQKFPVLSAITKTQSLWKKFFPPYFSLFFLSHAQLSIFTFSFKLFKFI